MRLQKWAVLGFSLAMLSGAAVWAQQLDRISPKTLSNWMRVEQDRRYMLANQIFLLEQQQKDLRSKLREAEARAVDLRDRIQKTERELEQARELAKGSHSNTGGSTRLELEKP